MAALGVHIQPVLMSALCLGLYVLYRVIVGPVGGRWWDAWEGFAVEGVDRGGEVEVVGVAAAGDVDVGL